MGSVEDMCAGSVDTTERGWGAIATNVPDPPKCIEECLEQFLGRVVQDYDETKFIQVCQALSDDGGKGGDRRLWELYCCDSVRCGVWINQTGSLLGQDPNINLIINTCQNIGSLSVHDPGPPVSTYTCPANSISQLNKASCRRPALQTNVSPHIMATRIPETITSTTFGLISSSWSLPPATSSSEGLSSAVANLSTPSTDIPSSAHGNAGELSSGVKVAIALCSVLALLTLGGALACFFRQRSKTRYPQGIRGRIKHHATPPAGSPTPLISPASSATGPATAPLTPPLRLRERRLLPTILGPARSSRGWPGTGTHTPSSAYSGFPTSPICAPTTNKLVPRHEQVPKVYGGPSPIVSHIAVSGKRGSLSSFVSNPTTTGSGVSAVSMSIAPGGTPPLSPIRPPRPHEAPLEIPDLVSPGPPPNRALPAAPLVSPISPNQPGTHGDIGVAIGLVSHNPAQGVVLQKDSQDLCELTERYARESRESWGSWGARGGGGPGVAISLPQRGTRARVNSPVIEEVDLERLAGRYQ